jgi:hypothetical protein
MVVSDMLGGMMLHELFQCEASRHYHTFNNKDVYHDK